MGYMFVLLTWEERYIIRRCSDDEHDLKPMLRAKMVRQLLLCGYLARSERGVYTVLHKIPDDLSCKKLERQARQVLEDRRKNGTPPISKDYNYKNKKR